MVVDRVYFVGNYMERVLKFNIMLLILINVYRCLKLCCT